MDAPDKSLRAARNADPELDDRLLTREALVSFLVRWCGSIETRQIINGFLKQFRANDPIARNAA